jgi:FkbM family methyltransferase
VSARERLRGAGRRVGSRLAPRASVTRTINAERIRLPLRWSAYYPPEYEPRKHRFLQEHCPEGSVVLDGGAHLGVFTVVMARAVGADGRVWAFEPERHVRAALLRTVELNACRHVDVDARALAGASGRAGLRAGAGPLSNASSIAETPGGAVEEVETVAVDALDERFACLKLDVEGAELAVLEGARKTLDRDAPALAVEVHPGILGANGVEALWELLVEHGYEVSVDGQMGSRRDFCAATAPFELQAVRAGARVPV